MPALYGGGAERSMLKLCRGIASRGYLVDLVLSRVEGPYVSEVPKSVRLVDLKSSRVLLSLPFLVRYLQKERPIALLSVLHANIIAIWARYLARVPTRIIVSERNTLSSEVQHYTSNLRKRMVPTLVRYFYPWAEFIVAVSQGVADDLTRIGRIRNERIRVIYNPIVTQELCEKMKVPLKHTWFQKDQPPVILSVGRLTEQKDFPTLIKAFARVRRNRTVRLIILGEGEERSELEALVKQLGVEKDVSLPGFIANPYPYMIQASAFILSSKWEGLPGVLIEALFCGTNLVATDCPSGPREILAGGKYGRLVPVGKVDALFHAINATLNDKKKSTPRESWQDFDLDVVVSKYLNVLLGR